MDVLIINGGMPKGGRTEPITHFFANKYSYDFLDIREVHLSLMTGEQDQWELPSVISFKERVGRNNSNFSRIPRRNEWCPKKYA